MNTARPTEHVETIVIGGGQAGLAVGYHLSQRNLPHVILDASDRVGDAWRKRWDSLRLFTPARYDGLPGMPFPASAHSFPSKDEVADYLEDYAEHFDLRVRNGVRVDSLSAGSDGYVLTAGPRRFEAENVVVAMASYQVPRLPSFANDLSPGIVQLAINEYRNPSQLQEGPVLVVGAGASGTEVALDVAGGHTTYLSGRYPKVIPFRPHTFLGRHIGLRVVRFMGYRVLTTSTPIGRKLRPKLLAETAPLVRVKPKDIEAAGVRHVARVAGVQDGLPLLENGDVLEVRNLVWCTGYRPDFSWIQLPIFGHGEKEPVHRRGIVPNHPGLYFVGLFFLHAIASSTLIGIGRDAEHVVKNIARRRSSEEPTTTGSPITTGQAR